MVEDIDQRIDRALEDTVNATNQSKHVKTELKKTILESVGSLRNIFHAVQKDVVDKSAKNIDLQTEVDQAKRELQAYRDKRAMTLVAQSIGRLQTPDTRHE